MNTFRVTKDRRVFLGDIEIQGCHGFDVIINAAEDPEVVLRVSCDSVTIEDYTDVFKGGDQVSVPQRKRREMAENLGTDRAFRNRDGTMTVR